MDIEFDPGKPVAVIFGENGTGKSTIVDAIAFGLTGDLGSLRFISVPGPRKQKYLHSIGTKPSDMQVSVTVGNATWKARLGKKDPEVEGPDDPPQVHVLRRVELLKLITSEPKKRYEAIQSLINVQRIEAAELELRLAVNDAKKALEFASERKVQAQKILEDHWSQSGAPRAASALEWARAEATGDLQTLKANIAAGRELLNASTVATEAWRELQVRAAEASDAVGMLRPLQERLETLRAEEDVQLLDVLECAQQILDPSSETCPLCEQPISAEDVRRRVANRLGALKEVRKLKGEIERAAKTAETTTSMLGQQRTSFELRRSLLVQQANALRGRFELLPVNTASHTDGEITAYLARIESVRPQLQNAIDADQKKANQQDLLTTNISAVDVATTNLIEFQAKAKRLEQISQAVESIRKHYVSEVLTDISDTAARMYTRLHPEEEIGGVSLYLKDAASGSLELIGSFAGNTEIPPQAYYSESHLDTLGLCVFLAMVERDPEAIVILDDVFTSVDDAHLGRILELLHDEAKNVGHLVVMTHYRAWRDRYKYARGPASHSQLIELLPWTASRGIRHTRTAPSVDELRENLFKEPLDRIGVAGRAGILLEALLDDLTLRYRCRLPRATDINYTLGELFGGIDSKLAKAMRVMKPAGDIALEPLLQKLLSMAFLRNQVGCHFNLAGSNISDRDVRAFGEATLAYAEAVICENCGELPRREKTGEYWQCACGSTKLVPLVKPGDKAA